MTVHWVTHFAHILSQDAAWLGRAPMTWPFLPVSLTPAWSPSFGM